MIATVNPDALDDGVPRVAATEFGRSVTCAVADDISDDEPFPLAAVTSNFRYLSTSSAVTVYVRPVAPAMSVYEPTTVDDRFHL